APATRAGVRGDPHRSADRAVTFLMQRNLHMKNLISLSYPAEDLAALDAALLVVEEKLANLVSLTPAQVRSLAKMGEKSEVVCRSVLEVLEQNPQVFTPALRLPEAQADLVMRCPETARSGWRDPRRSQGTA